MRLYEKNDVDLYLNSKANIPSHILNNKKLKVLVIDMDGAATDSKVEIDPQNNVLQASTAEQTYLVSGAAADKDAADGAVRTVDVIGVVDDLKEADKKDIVTQEEALDAEDGTTDADTDETYYDVWHMVAKTFGSADLDAEGAITLNKADDTTLLTIAAAAVEGNGSQLKVPEDWRGAILPESYITTYGAVTASQGVDCLLDILSSWEQTTDAEDGSLAEFVYRCVDFGKVHIDLNRILQPGDLVKFNVKQVGGAEDFRLHLEILLWRT